MRPVPELRLYAGRIGNYGKGTGSEAAAALRPKR